MGLFDIFKDAFGNGSKLFTTTSTILLISAIIVFWVFLKKKKRSYNLPPLVSGSLPLIGHIHLLTDSVHLKFAKWQKEYGPIFRINFGNKNAVVLNIYQDIKDTFKMNGMTDRHPAMFRVSSEYKTLLEMNGKEWNDRRKFITTALKATDRDKPNEEIVQEEVEKVLECFEKQNLSNDVDIRIWLTNATNNITYRMICGKRFEEDDPMMKITMELKEYFHAYLQMENLAASVSIPRFFLKMISSDYRGAVRSMKEMDNFFKNEIKSHEKNLDAEKTLDFIDLSLIEIGKLKDSLKPQMRNYIRGDGLLILVTATETVCFTLEWIFLFAAKYQKFQEKAYQEIMETIGNRKPNWQDHNSLPYTEAFLVECQRIATLVPVNISRCAPRDIVINGYDVPKGSLVIANFLAVHRDPNLYSNPEEFDPERFLKNDGKQIAIPEFFVSFSLGSRNCLGDKIAKMQIFLIFTTIMQKYRILPSSEGISFESSFQVAQKPLKTDIRLELR